MDKNFIRILKETTVDNSAHMFVILYLLNLFDRSDLRKLAKIENIKVGRDKTDTVRNLYLNRDKLNLKISLKLDNYS